MLKLERLKPGIEHELKKVMIIYDFHSLQFKSSDVKEYVVNILL